MSGQGIPAALIAFATIYPFFILGFSGFPLYNDVRGLEVLSMISHGPRFLEGLEIAGKVVCIVFQNP